MKRALCLTVILFFVASCGIAELKTNSTADQTRHIKPANDEILYIGRIDATDANQPIFSWPATQAVIQFTGREVSVIFDDEKGENFYNVFIDDDWDNPRVISLKKGSHTYKIFTSAYKQEHTLRLYKRTEGHEGHTAFKGFLLDADGQLNKKPKPKPRLIEIYGDSITSGMGNEAPFDAPDDKLAEKNSFLSYGAIAARQLNADFVSISLSGIGIMKSYGPYEMPQYYNRVTATSATGPLWQFSTWQPDVTVINLFQNDSSLVPNLDNSPSEQLRIAAYLSFLKTIRAKYPDTYIICSLGSMNATAADSPWPGYINEAIRLYQSEGGKRVDRLFFEFDGYGKHPRVTHHKSNAAKLSAFISEKLGW